MRMEEVSDKVEEEGDEEEEEEGGCCGKEDEEVEEGVGNEEEEEVDMFLGKTKWEQGNQEFKVQAGPDGQLAANWCRLVKEGD